MDGKCRVWGFRFGFHWFVAFLAFWPLGGFGSGPLPHTIQVSLHVPLTDETKASINKALFRV